MKATAFPKNLTYAEAYRPAMEITDPQDAKEYFEALVTRQIMHCGKTRVEAEKIERSNLGYWAGYYDRETAVRVLKLFGAAHPIFGTHEPTPEEALQTGINLAKR